MPKFYSIRVVEAKNQAEATTKTINQVFLTSDPLCDNLLSAGELIREMNGEEGSFILTSVHRDDLKERGYKTSQLSDDDMKDLVSNMADAYMETSFWQQLDEVSDMMNIPKLENPCPICTLTHDSNKLNPCLPL